MRKINCKEGEIMGIVRAMSSCLRLLPKPDYLKDDVEDICDMATTIIFKIYRAAYRESETNE